MGRIFLDTEFNGYKGELISIGLVNDHGSSLYAVFPPPRVVDMWVGSNVIPILGSTPKGILTRHLSIGRFQQVLQEYLQAEEGDIQIVSDWPDDIKYFCDLLITGPGKMLDIPGIDFAVRRVDPYLHPMKGAVQHHAMWDALCLRYCLTEQEDYYPFQPALPT